MPERHLTRHAQTADEAIAAMPCPVCEEPRTVTGRQEFGPVVIFQWRCDHCLVTGTSEMELKRYTPSPSAAGSSAITHTSAQRQ